MKFAYGSKNKINEAIEAGTIPAETLIITSDNIDIAELFFYDKSKLLKKVERKNKFLTLDEAKEWVPNWGMEGDVISVKNSKAIKKLLCSLQASEGLFLMILPKNFQKLDKRDKFMLIPTTNQFICGTKRRLLM